MSVNVSLHPRQWDVLESQANEILYGGSAGSGKSHLLRVIAIAACLDNPGLQCYIFRRHYPDLISNHFSGSGSFIDLLAPFVETGQCKINMASCDVIFSNGSAIRGRHVAHSSDVVKYQGAEINFLCLDETTHFDEYIYRFLRSRVRLGGLKIKDSWKNKLPGIICASNPGGVGHQFVKRMFIDGCKPDEIREMPKDEGGMRRQFIPAKLSDNPTLTGNDPDYITRLMGLGSPDLVKAMLDGNWDIVAGAAFEKLFRGTHQIRQFTPLPHWTRFSSLDWGTAKPYSVGWYCVPDEDVVLAAKGGYKEMLIPKNSIIRYREMYGWNGKPDEGCRQESWQVAQKMLCYELDCTDMIPDIEGGKDMSKPITDQRLKLKDRAEKIDYRIGDSAMWAQHDGPSVAENFAKQGVILEQSTKDRVANYLEMRNRIAPAKGLPGFYVTDNCLHFWRTVPELQLDERLPEKGPDTRQEDHVYDEVAYGLVSRPMVWTRLKRTENDYDDARKKAFEAERGSSVGRYS